MNRLAATVAGRWATAACAVFGAGVAVGYLCLGAASAAPLAVIAASAALTALILRTFSLRACGALAITAAALAGLARGAAAVEVPGPHRIDGHLGSGAVALAATVRQAPPGGGSVIVDVSHLTSGDNDVAVTGGLLVSGPALPAVAPGDTVEIDASTLRAPSRRPGPESAQLLEREDVEAVAVSAQMTVLQHAAFSIPRVVAALQARLVASVATVLPQPAAALLLGIAFGIHQTLPSDVRATLQDAGLIHIVVVSGLKVVMLLGLLAAVARALAWSPRRTFLFAPPIVGAYVLVSGAGPAAVRSAVMAGAAMAARWGGRRIDPAATLALVGAAMLAAAPALIRDPGFQLSFLGTAGILLMAEPIARRLPGPRLLAEPFAVTVAAQLATVPVMAGTFGVISLIGPAANALVLPLLPVLIVIGGGGAVIGAVAPWLSWLPLQIAGAGAGIISAVAQASTSLPLSFIAVGMWPFAWSVAEVVGLAILAGALIWRRALRSSALPRSKMTTARLAGAAVLIAVLAGAAASRPDSSLHATLLDTGSATAVLVTTGTGGSVLIDGGASPSQLLAALGRVLPPLSHRIDMVVITGGEHDAVAGLAGLPGHYGVGLVVTPDDLTPGAVSIVSSLASAGADVVDSAGRSWVWGDVLWHCYAYRSAKTGNSLCAVSAAAPDGRLLVLGDAGTDDQEELCAIYGRGLRVNVVVTPPGGALSPLLLATAQPSAVAVPVAKGSPAAPPPPHVVLARSGNDGDIAFTGSSGGLVEMT